MLNSLLSFKCLIGYGMAEQNSCLPQLYTRSLDFLNLLIIAWVPYASKELIYRKECFGHLGRFSFVIGHFVNFLTKICFASFCFDFEKFIQSISTLFENLSKIFAILLRNFKGFSPRKGHVKISLLPVIALSFPHFCP